MIVWLIILVVYLFCGVIIFFNRNLPKIQEFIFVAVSGMLVVVLGIVFYPENTLDKNISQVLFISLKEKKPLFPTTPILIQYYFPQGIVWGDCMAKDPNKTKKLLLRIPDDFGSLIDLQTISLLRYLSMAYGNNWNTQRAKVYFLPMSGFPSIGQQGRSLATVGRDKIIFVGKNLPDEIKENAFYKGLGEDFHLSLPRGTKIRYRTADDEKNFCQIQFYKRFAFDIRIKVYFRSYSAGLGEVSPYIGLSPVKNQWNVNSEERDNYGTVVVDIACEATFYKLRVGDPAIIRYKKWANALFDDLYNSFDWSVCNSKMREYNEMLAAQKIVGDIKKGFEQE